MSTSRKNNTAKKRKKKRQMKAVCALLCLCLAGILLGVGIFLIKNNSKSVDLEAGSDIAIETFVKAGTHIESFDIVTDISTIDTSKIGSYDVTIVINGKTKKYKLNIVDTVAPTAKAEELTVNVGAVLSAEDCLTDITDATKVTASFVQQPDTSKEGTSKCSIKLVDEGNNETIIEVTLNVLIDEEPPVIEGLKDKAVYIGDAISYKDGVTVTDDKDSNPILEIDNSLVDLNSAGMYQVTYTAKDHSGNSTSKTITVYVKEKPVSSIDEAMVRAKAEEILATIKKDDMSDIQLAFAIYRYVRGHIGYSGDSDKTDEAKEAYRGFTEGVGDCFTYYAAAKYLYDAAGIENIEVIKSDTSHSSHYWSLINIGFGWYHVDCTPRASHDDYLFMVTDEELEAYSVAHKNCHIFDHTLYPASETKSIQDRVNYAAARVE